MNIRQTIVKTIGTFFYVGYLPFMPGTFASLAALGVFYLVKDQGSVYLITAGCFIILGFFVSGEAEKIFKKKDHRSIVIDEVSGMLLSLAFVPYKFKLAIIAFFVFRLMDTLKPYPANRLQNLKGGWGVMGDDIVAAVYTNIVLQIAARLTSFIAS